MPSAERRRETLIALRATHTAHRIVNEIRYPELASDAATDPAFATFAPQELEALRQSALAAQRIRKIGDSRRRTRNWLILLAILFLIQLCMWVPVLL